MASRDCLDCGVKRGLKLQNVITARPNTNPLFYLCNRCGAQLTIPPPMPLAWKYWLSLGLTRTDRKRSMDNDQLCSRCPKCGSDKTSITLRSTRGSYCYCATCQHLWHDDVSTVTGRELRLPDSA